MKNKKGSMAIEVVISVLFFILFFAFFYDLTIITWKLIVTNRVTNEVSRILANQGGIRTSTPYNFPGGDKVYITSSELQQKINKIFGDAGIEKYEVYINNVEFNDSLNLTIDYGQKIEVKIVSYYDWTVFSSLVPTFNLDNKVIIAKQISMSEYKNNYDSWTGE